MSEEQFHPQKSKRGESSTLELSICTPPSIAAYQTRMTRDGEIANAGIPTKFGSVDEGRWTSCKEESSRRDS